MKRNVFIEEILEPLQRRELEINLSKGREYAAGDDDALQNFKLIAQMRGVTPLSVCATYMAKHFLSIMDYSNRGMVLSDESIEGRIADLRLYAALFLALAEEKKDELSKLSAT